MEFFRLEWLLEPAPVQWNVVQSQAQVLRGVHVHPTHFDYLMLVSGRASIGVQDIRANSPTHDMATVIEFQADQPQLLVIPPGVAHGFYFHEPSIHIYGISHYFNLKDELGCHFDDQDIHIPWTVPSPILSERDQLLPSYNIMVEDWKKKTRIH